MRITPYSQSRLAGQLAGHYLYALQNENGSFFLIIRTQENGHGLGGKWKRCVGFIEFQEGHDFVKFPVTHFT